MRVNKALEASREKSLDMNSDNDNLTYYNQYIQQL